MSLSPEAIRFALLTRFLKGQAKVPQMPEAAMRIRQLLDDPRTSLEQLARELEQIRECECGVQSWDLLQSISSLLGKAEQKQWLSQKEQQRALDWLAAAISR